MLHSASILIEESPQGIYMTKRVIKVECYSGMRADECPRSFILDEVEHSISEVLEYSIVEDFHSRRLTRCFLVETSEGQILKSHAVKMSGMLNHKSGNLFNMVSKTILHNARVILPEGTLPGA